MRVDLADAVTPAGYDLAAGGGEMGARVLRHDWAATPLGDLASWPQALRLTVGLLLESRHPMMLAWGPELRMLYNDACGETLGDRHPSALGAPASDAWGAAWTQLGPRLRLVLERAQAVHEQRIRLLVERGGVPEETFLTVSCTPVRHGHGVGGVLCHIVDETAQVVGERRLRALHGLAAGLASARTREALEKEAGPLLGRAPHDVPFALLYLRGSGGALRLASHAGLETAPTAPATLPDAAAWPCPEAGIGVVELGGLGLPSAGAGDLPPRQAAVVPVPAQAQEPAAGFLVLGLSPHRRFDEGYRAFLEALAAQVASGLASARSHQEERRQAEEKLQAALVASGSGTFRWYMHQDRVEFDDAIASLFGMRTPERVARVDDFAQVIHPDDRPGFFACIRACIEEGADFRMEFRVRMPDGSTRWVLDQGKSFRDAAGRPWYLTGACMDITERKVAEEELRASEARLRLAVEAGELGTWELDLRTGGSPRRTFRHDEIFGYREPLADWGYDVFLQHVLPEDRQAVDERFQAALQGGHDWHFECRIRRTDGEVRWIEARGRPATGADGRPERLLGIVADITERKTAEQERERLLAQLQLEQARLDAMVQQMPLGVFLAQAPDGRVVGYNAKAEEILGHPVVATDTPEDYARYGGEHPDGTPYRPEEYPAVRALRGEHIEQEDMVYRRGDGRLTTITVSASPVRDRAGRVMAAVCTFQDVAERRRIEQELAESERRYRFLADSIPQIVWTADASGRTDYYNGRWHEFTGLAPEESVAFGWQVSIHPEDLHPTLDAWQAAVRAKAPYRVEHRIRRFDGSYRWMLTQAAPMRDEAGRVLRWFGTSTDIDEAKRAEAEFRQESEERQAADRRLFTAMIEGSNDAIAAWDPGLRLTAFNRAFQEHVARLYGIKVTVGTKPLDTLQLLPEDRAKAEAALRRALQGETFTVASDFGPTAQERRYYETSYYPLRDGAGAVVGAFNVSRDITERVRMEQALRSSEQQLRQSQKMEAIGQLTGGVAHDFNNLLQVIRGNLQLLSGEVVGDAGRRRLGTAIGAVERGAKLTQQLLAFARRQPLEPKAINVSRTIRGMDDLLRRTLGEGIELETVIAGGLWNTFADPAQVESAILNLAVNARDAMDGHGKLTIEASNAMLDDLYASQHGDVQPGQYVMVAITDTGCGMPPEVLARAFEPFFTTKPEGKGTGLGLSMVYGFVKQSNGHVKIYSEVGHGTTVKLYLPRALEPEQAALEVQAGPVVGGSETVLVVEDDAEVRETVVELLEDLGYRVLKASDAQGALAILQSGIAVDLLFTDVVMPGPVRSPELARQAKGMQPGMAVLFTSGYTENAIVHGGRLDHGVDLLSKPYSREQLARKVRQMLANAQQRQAAQQAQRLARKPPAAAGGAALPVHSILLVEDDGDIRAATTDILEELGQHVTAVPSAEEALQVLAAARFDAVITDVALPGMSGLQLAREVMRKWPGTQVVVSSGYGSSSGEVLEDVDCQALPKPYGVAELEALLRRLPAGKREG